ncbi:MAG: 3-dehydroquinate synthase II [Syntrophobacteraceae bacterium]
MKQAWVRMDTVSDELIIAAVESGADVLILPAGGNERAKALGRICVVAQDGDMHPGRDVWFEPLNCPEDEARIRDLLHAGRKIVIAGAWEIIPVENLLAGPGGGSLFVPVGSAGEIESALGALEKGVAGVVITSSDPSEIRELVSRVKKISESASLGLARITRISPAGMGDRVCVDTCTSMVPGQGMLIGNSSGFLFFVQAETGKNPYVAPRPFRVNAGPVHSYIRVPGERTAYLSELGAGERVLVFRPEGEAEEATVGRVKIERRPLVLVEASIEEQTGSILLQNAETIRLSGPGGEAISVARLKPGDSVLVTAEAAGRHFGMKVEESIREC